MIEYKKEAPSKYPSIERDDYDIEYFLYHIIEEIELLLKKQPNIPISFFETDLKHIIHLSREAWDLVPEPNKADELIETFLEERK